MKKMYVYLMLICVGLLVLSLTSCDLAGLTIDARIDSFISDLNFDRYNAYTNFHPTATSYYDTLKDPTTTFNIIFPTSGIPYSRGTLDTSDPSNVTTVIDDSLTWGPKDAIFVMIKDGSTWYINDLYLKGAADLDPVLVIQ